MDEHYLDGRERAGGLAAGDPWNDIDVSAALEESHASREERLEQDLERIAEQLEGRDEIHADIVNELEWKIDRYTDRLETLYTTGRGKQDGERDRLKRRLTEIYRSCGMGVGSIGRIASRSNRNAGRCFGNQRCWTTIVC